MYWSLTPPAQWSAGRIGVPPNDTPLYFECADCGAQAPPIAGILSSDGTWNGIGFLGAASVDDIALSPRARPAMFCASCFTARLACEARIDAEIQQLLELGKDGIPCS